MPGRILPQRPTWRGLHQRLQENNTAILADTLDFGTLSIHAFSGSMLTPSTVFEALASSRIDYFIWAATKKVMATLTWESHPKDRQSLLLRVVDQLFLELASAIGDRLPGPYIVLVNPQKHGDMSSIIETAQRMHRTFTEQGVPRESIIVSIPATEAGILAAQSLQKEGMLTSLYLVTSLVHAQACVEAGVSAISISAGPVLDMHQRKRKTVYQKLSDNPGVEAIQAILAYFRLNNIKTKVIGMHFRDLEEIGLFSECDAVCVSAEQANEMRWSRAPTASLDLKEEPQVVLRAQQAKYPTDLLTRKGGFATWFSPESRSLTVDILREVLETMQSQMICLEHVVEGEIIRRVKLESPLKFRVNVETDKSTRPGRSELSTTKSADEKGRILSPDHLAEKISNAMDEVF